MQNGLHGRGCYCNDSCNDQTLFLFSDFIAKALAADGTENALVRAERGKLTLQQVRDESEAYLICISFLGVYLSLTLF